MPIATKFVRVVAHPSARVTLTRLILEKIGEVGEVLLDSFFPAKYPEARLWRRLLGLDPIYEFKRATFSSILSQLAAQGLVERVRKQGGGHWRLTRRGRQTVRAPAVDVSVPRSDGKKRLVCFDIPESDRAKRRWLRGELAACGYRPLQKSVWLGETPLPHDFLLALDTLNLRGRIHILRVESEGTLGRLPAHQ